MRKANLKTIAEQVAEHLKQELNRRRWTDTMPGKHQLAGELGVNNKTVERALRQLEKEGVLINQGAGKRRLIKNSRETQNAHKLRVALFLLDEIDRHDYYAIELYHTLEEAGHVPFHTDRPSSYFGEKITQLPRYVKKAGADAWIIVSGSRPVLEWFSSQKIPAFALFGRHGGLPIASTGPDKAPAVSAATTRLIDLGHRRISLLCRTQRRLPAPGESERIFLQCLEKAGITTSKFNLPDWTESKEGFLAMLDSLFGPTPPTALIVDEAFLYNATYYFLSNRGLNVPRDVSLICTDHDPHFAWCEPSVAHIRWNYRKVILRTVRWLEKIGDGHNNHRHSRTKAEFVEGGTIGKAP